MKLHLITLLAVSIVSCGRKPSEQSDLEFNVMASKVLNLTATGVITKKKSDSTDMQVTSPITTVAFDFTGSSKSKSQVDVVSAPIKFALLNAEVYPATVVLERPSSCAIGATAINDGDVALFYNGQPISTNSAISIPTSQKYEYRLMFLAKGKYGRLNGAVTCSVPGTLTYSY